LDGVICKYYLLQYKGIKNNLRVGYTYNTNPIGISIFLSFCNSSDSKCLSIWFGYEISEKLILNAVYHNAASDGSTEGLYTTQC
jgi:long-chain fatty acid transport protein